MTPDVFIPNRMADVTKPSPLLRETVTLRGDNGAFGIFDGLPVLHGFQWRNPTNVAYTREPDYPSNDALKRVRGNVERFLFGLGMNGEFPVLAHAVPGHTGIIHITDASVLEDRGIQGRYTSEGSAFFTTIPGMALYSTMRDCTQTVFYAERDGDTPVVGLIHGGRAEAHAKVPLTAIRDAIRRYDLDLKNIKLGIAPSLEPEFHFIQAKDFRTHIRDPRWEPYYVQPEENSPFFVDVRSNVADQYMAAGIPPENIELILAGTYEAAGKNEGFSFRRAGTTGEQSYCFGIAVQIPDIEKKSDQDIILITDSRVQNKEIRENGEELINLLEIDDIRKPLLQTKQQPILIRRSVAERLLLAQDNLPSDIVFKFKEGYRSPEVQQRYFDAYTQQIRDSHQDWDEDRIFHEASKFATPLIYNPPHTSGAAIDLTLQTKNGIELDMGQISRTEIDGTEPTFAERISEVGRRNRNILIKAMNNAGLVNYRNEWWHWSFGDQMWAYYKNRPYALFGTI